MLLTPSEPTSPDGAHGSAARAAIAEARSQQQIIWAQQVNICVSYQDHEPKPQFCVLSRIDPPG